MTAPNPDRDAADRVEPLDVVPGGLAPPRPHDEDARLAEVRELGVLDYRGDPDLDSLIDLAALVTGAPIALLTVVGEDDQVFASCVGLDADGTSRDVSFCGHAILNPLEPMIVRDARLDGRFADNPLVTGGPNVVFYAGIPILTSGGHAIGTLCVVDDKPREISERQVAALTRLAGQAAGLIEARAGEGAARRGAARPVGLVDDATDLPLRELLVAQADRAGGLPRTASALAIRVEEIDASVAGGGLLADGAMRAVARAIVSCVPPQAQVARAFGIFVVLLPGMEGTAARGVVTAIRNRLRGAVVAGSGLSLHVGLTAGIATTTNGERVPVDGLLAAAEEALRQTETFGLTALTLDDDATDARARTATIRSDLPSAVTDGQLVVHYQPIVQLPSGEAVGSEALVRWRHPQLGLLSPDEFIPYAEDMGIIQEIDRYVMRRALRDFADGATPGDHVSVNLSPVSIRASLRDVIDSDVRDARVRPDALMLEITERVRLDRDPDVLEILHGVADTGARLAIDDFGAGTTSLAHLRNLPVNRLKLDRSLISDLTGPDGERATMVVRTLVDLARHLGIEVLAEGVEEAAQRDVLIEAGVTLAQGYFFGRPGPLHPA